MNEYKGKSNLEGKNIFVTGATGFLGSYLVKELLKFNSNIICLVRDVVSSSLFFKDGLDKKVTMINGDLIDNYLIERAIVEYDVDVIFHLGAQALVGIANKSPVQTLEQNIKGTWNVLEAARKHKVKATIVASSDKAYGDSDALPYREETPLRGKHPYDVSKSCADLIAQAYFKTYNLPVIIVRCGNIFGGGDLNFSRIIPGTIRDLLNNARPVIRSDGKLVRDYIFVLDVVDAYIKICEFLLDGKCMGEAFNIGYEKQYTVIEIVDKVKEMMGKKHVQPRILDIAKNEIEKQWLSCEKAKKLLGWKPKYNFEDGLKMTIEWYKKEYKVSF